MADSDVQMTDSPVPDPGPEVTAQPIPDPEPDTNGTGLKRPAATTLGLMNKRFKASELPLTEEQTSTIEKLIYTFKKKGGFDLLRKEVWAKYEDSVCCSKSVRLS